MNTVNTRKKFFPNVTDEEWNDWTWQVKNRIEKIDDLKKYVELSAEEEEGVVRTLDPIKGIISVISTEDFKDFMRDVLIDLGNKWVDLKIIEEGAWKGTL